MFSLIVIFKVKKGKKSAFLHAISPIVELTKSEPGNLQYQLNIDESNEDNFFLFECYRDRTAYEAHTKKTYLSTFRADLDSLLLEPPIVMRGSVIEK
jgi:quinol monooxygenase YgiN